jgi:hypothetical protein
MKSSYYVRPGNGGYREDLVETYESRKSMNDVNLDRLWLIFIFFVNICSNLFASAAKPHFIAQSL